MTEQAAFSAREVFYAGATLGGYVLKQLLEERAETGPIFLARHVHSGALYRLRVLLPPTGITPEDRLIALGQFQKVAGQLTTLRHPLLLALTDYGSVQSIPYLISPMSSAQLLQTLLPSGPLDLLLVGSYLDEIASALEYAHQQGILHLNLTTRCILVRKAGSLYVTDFALPRLFADQRPSASSTSQNAALLFDRQGKLLYSLDLASAPAPELLRGEAIDARTDVYALGAVLYQMLTGHRVFRGATLQELAQQHLQAPIQPPGAWRKELPRTLDAFFMQALAKDPGQRFPSPGALADAYHQIVAPAHPSRQPFALSKRSASVAPLDGLPRAENAASEMPHKAPGRISRRLVMALAVAGGGVIMAGGTYVLITPSLKSKGSNARSANPQTSAPPTGPESRTPSAASATPLLANTSDLPPNSAKAFPLAQSNNPGLLIHLLNDHFVAFNSTCTHAGCAVNYNRQDHLLVCPCHGSVFDPSKNGTVLQGPATLPLVPIAITVHADKSITLDQ